MGHFNEPDGRFAHLNIDIVGPLLNAKGFSYLLTIMDRFSMWPAAFPTKDISAESVARTILEQWITIYGVLLVITIDKRSFDLC